VTGGARPSTRPGRRPTPPGPERRFDFLVTHDRDLVIRAAEPLLRRLVGTP
jgi:hypothetical protein